MENNKKSFDIEKIKIKLTAIAEKYMPNDTKGEELTEDEKNSFRMGVLGTALGIIDRDSQGTASLRGDLEQYRAAHLPNLTGVITSLMDSGRIANDSGGKIFPAASKEIRAAISGNTVSYPDSPNSSRGRG